MTFISFLIVFTFITTVMIRLFVYYHSGNELIFESVNISMALWESNWHQQSPQIKSMLLLVMRRAQKPLCYKIGGFGVMSLQSIIAVNLD